MTRTLYYAQRSPYARKVRILLAEKNLPCELKETDFANKSPDFLDISPIGKVPVLVDEDGTTIWDSTLIIEYLDETYPQPSFYPSDRKQRLECRKWEDLADTLADNIVALWLQNRKGDKADASDKAKYQAAIDRLLPILDKQLSASPYLLGENWTAADVAAVSTLGYYSLRFGSDWQQKYLRLGQLFNNLHERESVKSSIPQG
ncbi:glutathione S-transferase family protein [Microcoleus sp. FACHB-831]|uniref:glutathione S-transferase family protein n=1 Tax=Microcoleus sp. FACHB-831 TaxID=2692827 RepID=UPI0016885109|nr:glutathione S-transferase family protein [Microcoleus sp. FACHB-831]MBD1920244.1 glutathione S-transferase family protein [Microcoleus sp. FACHB-831]